jgi:hypothetical protein
VVWNITGVGCPGFSPNDLTTADIHQFLSTYDLVLLTETWLMPEDSFEIEGYDTLSFARPSRRGRSRHGGLLVAWRQKSNMNVDILARKDDYYVLLDVSCNGAAWLVGLVYNPPASSPYRRGNLFEELGNDIAFHGLGKKILLLGDFNARTKNMQSLPYQTSHPRVSMDETMNNDGRDFLDMLSQLDMCILNGAVGADADIGRATFEIASGRSVVDYGAATRSALPGCGFAVLPMRVKSHHCPIDTALTFPKVQCRVLPSRGPILKMAKRLVVKPEGLRSISQAVRLAPAVMADLSHFSDALRDPAVPIEELADRFTVLVYSIAGPLGRICTSGATKRFPTNEWYDEECKVAKRAVHEASKRGDMTAFLALKQEYHRVTQLKKRQANARTYDEIQELYEHDKSGMWRAVKRFSKKTESCPIELDDFLEDMEKQHSPAAATDDSNNMDEFVRRNIDVPKCDDALLAVLDKPIEQEEVVVACKQLKQGKSVGSDGIPMNVLNCLISCTTILTALFNVVLSRGEYPAQWIEGMIAPILKPGKSASVPSNYRKITVIPHIGKLFEKVMENRLAIFESVAGSIDILNNGFSKGYRPADNLVILDCIIRRYRGMRRPVYVALIDFTQAFDLVNRNGLFYKLILMGFGSNALKTMHSMYQKSSSGFRLNGKVTDCIRTLLGVNQGSILSPRLFKKFFQDLKDYLTAPGVFLNNIMVRYLLWADDLVLLAADAMSLQSQLKNLEAYCQRSKMKINPTKTRIMLFDNIRGRKAVEDAPTFTLEGEVIHLSQGDVAYLGVTLNPQSADHMRAHVAEACKKAQKSLYRIYSLCKGVGTLPPQVAMKLFDSLVASVLRYGCEVWYSPVKACVDPVEKVHLKYMRYVLGVRQSTPIVALYGELGRAPLDISFRRQVVKYARYLFCRDDLLPQSPLWAARQYMTECWDIGVPCWLTKVSSLSDSATVDGILSGTLCVDGWVNGVRNRWRDDWLNQVTGTSKLRTYMLFKRSPVQELYLSHVRNVKHRKALTRLRVSSHNLAVERGRWTRPSTPSELRLCRHPGCDCVEDEMHVLVSCVRYAAAREALYASLREYGRHMVPFTAECFMLYVMMDENADVCKALARFISCVFTAHADVV